MRTLQSAVAQIRALEVEEIDLVGGGYTVGTETVPDPSISAFVYTTADGHYVTVSAVDDMEFIPMTSPD